MNENRPIDNAAEQRKIAMDRMVVAARRGDTCAYTDLVEMLRPTIAAKAGRVANQTGVDEHDVESALWEAFQACFEQYSPQVGHFAHFLATSFATAIKHVRTLRMNDKYASNVQMSLDAPARGLDGNETPVGDRVADGRVNVEGVVMTSRTLREVYDKVRQSDAVAARVLQMLAEGGYTHEDIARACGYEGTAPGAKMWTKRRIETLRRLVDKDVLCG